MKIATWNVNGIRSAYRKGLLDFFRDYSPDVVCLQEIKARTGQFPAEITEVPGYRYHVNSAERPGYSGVALFSKPEIQSVRLGMDNPLFDREGRVIGFRLAGIRFFNVYFPNGQRGRERVEYKLAFYAHLLEECDRLHAQGESIVICGDFNTAHQEIDLANPKENQNTSGFLLEERAWIDQYLSHGFSDAYRELYPGRVQYTWWTYRFGARKRNIGWRLDYFLVSRGLMANVKDVIVHDEVEGSDHCPVVLELEAVA
jgi:exodeoxyribonuclease-3